MLVWKQKQTQKQHRSRTEGEAEGEAEGKAEVEEDGDGCTRQNGNDVICALVPWKRERVQSERSDFDKAERRPERQLRTAYCVLRIAYCVLFIVL